MLNRKVTLLLNQRLTESWALDALTFDAGILSGVQSEWESLVPSVKVNVLCSVFGMRNRAAELSSAINSIIGLALDDKDDWVRLTGQILEPLLADPPAVVNLDNETYVTTVKQIEALLKQHGPPAWRPFYQAYMDSTAASTPVEKNDFFAIRDELKLMPLKPHADPKSLVPSTSTAVPVASASNDSFRLSRVPVIPAHVADRRMGSGNLRSTSTLLEKKPYQQKKAVRSLTVEQVQVLAQREEAETGPAKRILLHSDSIPAVETNQSAIDSTSTPSVDSLTNLTDDSLLNQPHGDPSGLSSLSDLDSLASAEPPAKQARVDLSDLTSLGSLTESLVSSSSSSSLPATLRSSGGHDADAAESLTALNSLSDLFAMPPPATSTPADEKEDGKS